MFEAPELKCFKFNLIFKFFFTIAVFNLRFKKYLESIILKNMFSKIYPDKSYKCVDYKS